MTERQSLLLRKHIERDAALLAPNAPPFISGWQTEHPFEQEYLPLTLFAEPAFAGELAKYRSLHHNYRLKDLIRSFHWRNDGVSYSDDEIYITAGASPLILAQLLWIRSTGVREVFYAPPLFHSHYQLAELLGLRLVPICNRALSSSKLELNLPSQRVHLFICDPVWIFGHRVPEHVIRTLRSWQEATGSFLHIDGTFQYLTWAPDAFLEQSSQFARDSSMRLICPTKSLAIHGVRFAYLLIPAHLYPSIRYACSCATGSTGSWNLHAAKHIMALLNTENRNKSLIDYAKEQLSSYCSQGIVKHMEGVIDTGYYIFGQLGDRYRDHEFITMDQDFFDLADYPDLYRINLLGTDLKTLLLRYGGH